MFCFQRHEQLPAAHKRSCCLDRERIIQPPRAVAGRSEFARCEAQVQAVGRCGAELHRAMQPCADGRNEILHVQLAEAIEQHRELLRIELIADELQAQFLACLTRPRCRGISEHGQ